MSRSAAAVVAALVASAVLLASSIDDKVPAAPDRYVTDRAGVFSPDRAEALNARLDQFERETSDQILVWIDRRIPEGFTLEDFTVRAAQKWRVGQKGKDNGAVLFVFVDDRKMRIEVGYGLEGSLPDALAHRIQEEEILPRFRSGDYAGGIEAGVSGITAAIKGEYKGTGRTVADSRRRTSFPINNCFVLLFILLFIVGPMLFRARRGVGRTYGGGWWSGGGWGGGGGGGFSGGGFSGGGGSFGGGGSSGSW
ncbi:MAG TPA: TPM domain-containing protein [Thermoanaerobaculia bacterium]